MLLRSQRVVIESRLSPDAVLAQLRLRANERDESPLSPAAQAAGILSWVVRARDGRVVVTPRIDSQSAFLPEFVGEILPTGAGSVMRGHLQVHWFTRALLFGWVTVAATIPLLASVGSKVMAIVMIAIAFMLFPFVGTVFVTGPWLADRASNLAGRATVELLKEVARDEAQQIGSIA